MTRDDEYGGAQLVISPGGTDRVANLVLVSCEAFDNYPPGLPGRLLCLNAALPSGTFLTAQLLRPRWIRHLPVIFGTRHPKSRPQPTWSARAAQATPKSRVASGRNPSLPISWRSSPTIRAEG